MNQVVNIQEWPSFCREKFPLLWHVNEQINVTASREPARQLGNTDIILSRRAFLNARSMWLDTSLGTNKGE